jgi:hypothetical protein
MRDIIYDPGTPWHKDDMEDEDPRPGINEPIGDEHGPDKAADWDELADLQQEREEADYNNEAWRKGHGKRTLDGDEVPF